MKATALAGVMLSCSFGLSSGSLVGMFEHWRKMHGKEYATEEERALRYRNFIESHRMVQEHNALPYVTYSLALNKFADQSWEEWRASLFGEGQNCSATLEGNYYPTGVDLPEAIDWRDKGAVSPVKDQGSCGSCWTFSTTGALESHYFLKHGEMKLFSEQQLVDCAQAFDNNGCNGGLPSHAFEYLYYAGGIETEDSYPYEGTDEKCAFSTDKVSASVSSSVNITFMAEDQLLEAVGTVGPVSVAFQVAPDFRFYSSGVYVSDICRDGPENVNHAVLAVGYDMTNDAGPYWIIKNSWSEDWGESGYFRMAMGLNMCGISDCASYPVMA